MNENLHLLVPRKRMRFIQMACLLLWSVLLAQSSIAQSWTPPIRPLNPNEGTGGWGAEQIATCIVNGNPALVYMDQTRGDMVYVRATNAAGTTWGTPITIEYKYHVGATLSLEMVNGNPAISYDVTNFDDNIKMLKYIRATDAIGSSWGTPVVLAQDITYTYNTLKVINGLPSVFYYDEANLQLKCIRATDNNGSSWGTPAVLDANGDVGRHISVAVVNGNPAIAYFDATNYHLKYIRATDASGTAWSTPVVLNSAEPTLCQFTSLEIVDGFPAIAYYDFDNTRLKFVRASDANGSAWSAPITVKSGTGWGNSVGRWCTLKVINGVPSICYYEETSIGIHIIRASTSTGSSWNASVRVWAGYASGVSMLFVDGNPTIAYVSTSSHTVNYFRSTNTSGSSWPATSVSFSSMGEVGRHNSQLMVDGCPAFTYYDITNKDLMYVRALDAMGLTWGTPLRLDGAASDVGAYCSLQLVDGKPAVAYYDEENGYLKFVLANDVKGLTWRTPMTVVSSGTAGQYASLQVVNGNPAIAYFDTDRSGSLKYVRATNPTGTNWGSPVFAYEPEGWEAGRYASMQVVNGRPAIAFYSSDGYLQYVRANDANGSTWGPPQNPDGTNSGGQWACLKVIDGMPTIVHASEYEGLLKYSRATNIDGNTWAAAIQPDESYGVGMYASLEVIDGKPAISYYDGDNNQLKYVAATNATGTVWGTPVVPDNLKNSGTYTSLIFTGTGPGIVYYNEQDRIPNFITTVGSVLPVTITNIRAYQKAAANQIEWIAFHEINIKTYEVEKSQDGRQFTLVGTLFPKENAPQIYYQLSDNTPLAGMNFYRIKTVDKDGSVKYSAIVKVNRTQTDAKLLNVFPNPLTSNAITVQLNLPKGTYTLRLTSSNGTTLISRQLIHAGGSSSTNFTIAQMMPAGVYQLVIEGEGIQISKQILKH